MDKSTHTQKRTRPGAAACPPVPCPARTATVVDRGGTRSGSSPENKPHQQSSNRSINQVKCSLQYGNRYRNLSPLTINSKR